MRKHFWPVAVLVAATLASCGSEPAAQDELNEDAAVDCTKAERLATTKKIFYNIPSPMETAVLLKKAGAEYNSKILNDVKNVDRYTAASQQALNLGVYGADLSYASVFNHTQESMFYNSCSRKLADRLGVTSAFNDSTLEVIIKEISPRPILFVHGEKAHSLYFAQTAYAAAAQPKELVIVKGANHVDLYDKVDKIPFEKITEFFTKYLKG